MNGTCMLSTIDNPFNPFVDFRSWFQFDIEKGYNSCALLARIAHFEDDFSDEESNAEIERAIDQIIDNDFLGIYIKLTPQFVVDDDIYVDED